MSKNQCDDDEATGTRVTTININVTPLLVDGMDAVCQIEPASEADAAYVRHGLVRLPAGPPCDLRFHLQEGACPELEFDTERPWSSRPRKCPDPDDNDDQKFPNARLENAKLLNVRAAPAPSNALHYSLNFAGDIRCDPIIIRE